MHTYPSVQSYSDLKAPPVILRSALRIAPVLGLACTCPGEYCLAYKAFTAARLTLYMRVQVHNIIPAVFPACTVSSHIGGDVPPPIFKGANATPLGLCRSHLSSARRLLYNNRLSAGKTQHINRSTAKTFVHPPFHRLDDAIRQPGLPQ